MLLYMYKFYLFCCLSYREAINFVIKCSASKVNGKSVKVYILELFNRIIRLFSLCSIFLMIKTVQLVS